MEGHDHTPNHIVDAWAQSPAGNYGRGDFFRVKIDMLSWPGLLQADGCLAGTKTMIVMGQGQIEDQPIRFTYKIKKIIPFCGAQFYGGIELRFPQLFNIKTICYAHYNLVYKCSVNAWCESIKGPPLRISSEAWFANLSKLI